MTKELILSVVIKREREGYSSWCPELDVASQGDSIEEARKNLQEAVELHVETMAQNGDLQALLDKLGLTTKDLQKETILPEFFSGPLEIPLAV